MKQTDREGVNAVEGIVLRELKWVFREQPISDWGIDAHVEVTNQDEPIGRLLALQIKSGKSFFRKRGNNYVFYGEGRHLRYWRNHSLPVTIVLHDPDTGLTLWQRVEESLIKYNGMVTKGLRIEEERDVGIICVDCASFKEVFMPSPKRCREIIREALPSLSAKKNKEIMEGMAQAAFKLNVVPSSTIE